MSFDYSAIVATATELIQDFGRSVTLTKVSRTPENSSQPWREPTATAVSSIGLTGVFVDPKEIDFGFQSEDDDGQLTRSATKKVLVDAASVGSVSLEDYDELSDGTEKWKIVRINTLKPGATAILYEIEVVQ